MNKKTLSLLLLFFIGDAFSAIKVPPDEPPQSETPASTQYNIRLGLSFNITPETTDLIGESIELSSGTVAFSMADFNISGNSAIPFSISRSFVSGQRNDDKVYAFADWQLDTPRIESAYISNYGDWANNKECLGDLNPREAWWQGSLLSSSTYWNGVSISVPGKSHSKLLRNYGNVVSQNEAPYITKDNWKISCIARKNTQGSVVGDGFKAISPDGLEYTFDVRKNVLLKNIVGGKPAPYFKTFMYASAVTDRFGNEVNYTYDTRGNLQAISANDGRSLSIEYISGTQYIESVTVNGRTWRYTYNGSGPTRTLHTVTQPDNNKWVYSLSAFTEDTFQHNNLNNSCRASDISDKRTRVGTVTHPNGVVVKFTTQATLHGRTNVPSYRVDNNYMYSRCAPQFSLIEKTLSGPGIDTLTWGYNYSQNAGAYDPNGFTGDTTPGKLTGGLPSNVDDSNFKTTTVSSPDGSKTQYFFNRDFSSAFEGKKYAEYIYDVDGISLVKVIEMDYEEGARLGTSMVERENDKPNSIRANISEQRVIQYDLYNNEDAYTTVYTGYDKYGFAKNKIESNTFEANKKYTQTIYYHDLTNWLLGLNTSTKLSSNGSSYTEVEKTTYWPATSVYKSLPNYFYKNNMWIKQNASYITTGNQAGLLNRVNFNNTNRWYELSDYKRGMPRSIKVPARVGTGEVTINRMVDNNGWVTRTTDYNGVSTYYTYDDIGRIQSIDLVNDATYGRWYDTLYAWDNDTNARTISKCMLNSSRTACAGSAVFKTTEYYDNLLRLTKTKSQDLVNSSAANSTRYQRFEYNYLNQPTFQSYASANVSENKGTTTVYDSLGRQQSVTTSGLGTVNYAYLSGNRIEVTDAKDNVTTTTYQAFGSPSYSQAVKIESPEDVTTQMDVDIFGLTHSITQTAANQHGNTVSVTEHRYYDNTKQLCLITRPDVGNTVYKYSVLGELTWSKSGVTNTECASTAPSQSTLYTYDNLGDLYHVNYPDNSGDVTYERDNNGNVLTLTAGDVTHRYTYNNQNLLEEEQLYVGSELSLMLGYSYNELMHKSTVSYPDGTIVNFKPNGFGEPTEVQAYKNGVAELSFATDAHYYANGMLDSFTYGNGVTHKTTLYSDSLLPKQLKDTGPSGSNLLSTVMSLTYDYDNNTHITSIVDGQNSAYSLTDLQYDDLDRLTRTTGGSGIGSSSLRYDGFGNITYYQSKGKTLNYTYDYTKNRLSKVTGVSGRYGIIDYDDQGNIKHNGAYSLDFNAANQLTTAKGNSYLYDGHNRRVKQTDGNGTSYSMYSQDGMLLYREKGNTITGNGTNYIYLGKKLIAKYGDVTPQSVDESRQHTRPFGETIEAPKDDVGYTGHKFDTDLGLSYMQARYYDPVIGRFYSNDPVSAIGHFKTGNGPVHGFNRYAYANNNPYRFVDPTGMAVEVTLKAYPIGQAPIVGKYGHAFVEYRDTDTGESRITRGGPSKSYPGGASDAIMDSSFDGVNLIANDTPASESADFGEAGTETLMSTTVDKTMSEVTGQVQKLNSEVNGANIPYQPRGQNSNTYAGNAYQQLTGQKPVNNTDIALPALEKELDK